MADAIDSTAPDLARLRAAAASGDRNQAIDLAIAARKAGSLDPLVLRWVAAGMEEDGLVEDAARLLERATEDDPSDLSGWIAYSRALSRIGQHKVALQAANTALDMAPDDAEANRAAGEVWIGLAQVGRAREYFRKADALSPGDPSTLSVLAGLAVRQGDAEVARSMGVQALALRPDLLEAAIAVARAEVIEGRTASAESRLTQLLPRRDLEDDKRAQILSFLADALDAENRSTEAFALYTAANSQWDRSRSTPLRAAAPETALVNARRLHAWLEKTTADDWRPSFGPEDLDPSPVATHVFLLGFPRSGTTLLEQALGSHPDVATIEERGLLQQVAGHLLASDAGMDRLLCLRPAAARACREVYWRGARELSGEEIEGRTLVDKMPLNTLALPLIARIFPEAKVLFALRDPRDVALSCFRRRFQINLAMSEFVTLQGVAEFYDEVMRLGEAYRARMPLDLATVRHEELVEDFDRELTRILAYMGLDWNPAVREFAARASARANTPSAAQLARGLSSEGVGAWRRYGRAMKPVLPTLETWVKRFGYAPTPAPLLATGPSSSARRARQPVEQAVSRGAWDEATAAAGAALKSGVDDPLFHRVLGVRAQAAGRPEAAVAEFEKALEDAPAEPHLLGATGLAMAQAGRPAEALVRLDAAILIAPNEPALHFNRGWALEAMGHLEAARDAYGRAVNIAPGHAQALAHLAVLEGRAGRWDEARRAAEAALAADPNQPSAATTLARAEVEAGETAAAEDRLRRLIAAGPPPHERAYALGALGDILDAEDRPAEAFDAWSEGAAILRQLHGPRFAGLESAPALVARLQAHFAASAPLAAGPPASGPAEGHVFVVGFPRSGTTLTGQILARHPRVETLDERETLKDAIARFYGDQEGLAALANADETELAALRDLYWNRVSAAGARPHGRIFVDKLPMNTLGLPIIARLFPAARIVFLRRDPRDVVLSCFRRRFALDPTTLEFLTLAAAAGLYDGVMTLAETFARVVALPWRTQSFEALVGDFDNETRALCDFLGLDWTPDLADFAARAAKVATPSSAQLARGLSGEGIGVWRRYRDQLEPILPVLAPWATRFGYGAK